MASPCVRSPASRPPKTCRAEGTASGHAHAFPHGGHMTQIEIGRLLRAGTTGFTAGCRVNQLEAPCFGALVSAPLDRGYEVYGLIYDIHIDDDGLVRQLVTADNVTPEVFRDNRERRIVPVELSILVVGYKQDGRIYHM